MLVVKPVCVIQIQVNHHQYNRLNLCLLYRDNQPCVTTGAGRGCDTVILGAGSEFLRDPGPSVGCWLSPPGQAAWGRGEILDSPPFLWPFRGSSQVLSKAPVTGSPARSGNASTALPPLPGNHWTPVSAALGQKLGSGINWAQPRVWRIQLSKESLLFNSVELLLSD